ncbi:MAG: cytochrome c5 family protein, partial [Betaproteobacteria bacterium]|nr:cytochrome c5 family protein [Betaproteobacteria bacterium]
TILQSAHCCATALEASAAEKHRPVGIPPEAPPAPAPAPAPAPQAESPGATTGSAPDL